MSAVLSRVTPRQAMPEPVASVRLSAEKRARVHMIGSLLLDYPDAVWFDRLPTLRAQLAGLPHELIAPIAEFIDTADAAGELAWQRLYVTTFDLKRKCSLYLSYYATGDTRRRGVATTPTPVRTG